MYIISKEFQFDAAHRLYGYDGICSNLHGHRYKVEVFIREEVLNDAGMVVDFSLMKKTVSSWLDCHWDHATLLYSKDPLRVPLKAAKVRVFLFDENPTAEVMASFLFGRLKNYFDGMLQKVVVWETPTSKAAYFE